MEEQRYLVGSGVPAGWKEGAVALRVVPLGGEVVTALGAILEEYEIFGVVLV